MRVAGEAAATRRSDLATRALAGAAAAAVALSGLWAGGIAFWALATALAALMVGEWAGLMHASPARTRALVVLFVVGALVLCPLLLGPNRDAVAVIAATAIVAAIATGSMRLGIGIAYAGLPLAGLLFLRVQPDGVGLTLWTMFVVWGTDVGAYFAGRAIGGPKLAPRLSPNKTWAGLGGGMAVAMVVGATIAALAGLPRAFLWLGAPMAVLAQIGDLFESWLKRRAGVKDSGRLLPGHGGAMDRLDGLVPVASVIAGLIAGGWL